MKCCLWLDNFVVWSVGTCVLSLLVFPFINKLKTHLIDLSLIIMLQEAWNKLSLNISDCKKRYPIRCLLTIHYKVKEQKSKLKRRLSQILTYKYVCIFKMKMKKKFKKKIYKRKKRHKEGFFLFAFCLNMFNFQLIGGS